MDTPTLYLILSGAGGAAPSTGLAARLVDEGWEVTVICTPTGTRFHDLAELERITGRPVRVEFRRPGTGQRLPAPDCMVALLSFNSFNKAAAGITDTMAVAVLCEMAGAGVPAIVLPKANPALCAHPAFRRSGAALAEMPSVRILGEGTGESLPGWDDVAAAARAAVAATPG